jgi:hypothetical protein
MLGQIKAIFRKRHGGRNDFRLCCDYFDLIAGTSTGASLWPGSNDGTGPGLFLPFPGQTRFGYQFFQSCVKTTAVITQQKEGSTVIISLDDFKVLKKSHTHIIISVTVLRRNTSS